MKVTFELSDEQWNLFVEMLEINTESLVQQISQVQEAVNDERYSAEEKEKLNHYFSQILVPNMEMVVELLQACVAADPAKQLDVPAQPKIIVPS